MIFQVPMPIKQGRMTLLVINTGSGRGGQLGLNALYKTKTDFVNPRYILRNSPGVLHNGCVIWYWLLQNNAGAAQFPSNVVRTMPMGGHMLSHDNALPKTSFWFEYGSYSLSCLTLRQRFFTCSVPWITFSLIKCSMLLRRWQLAYLFYLESCEFLSVLRVEIWKAFRR